MFVRSWASSTDLLFHKSQKTPKCIDRKSNSQQYRDEILIRDLVLRKCESLLQNSKDPCHGGNARQDTSADDEPSNSQRVIVTACVTSAQNKGNAYMDQVGIPQCHRRWRPRMLSGSESACYRRRSQLRLLNCKQLKGFQMPIIHTKRRIPRQPDVPSPPSPKTDTLPVSPKQCCRASNAEAPAVRSQS